jgi:hypothetical protein
LTLLDYAANIAMHWLFFYGPPHRRRSLPCTLLNSTSPPPITPHRLIHFTLYRLRFCETPKTSRLASF